jgi:ribonuclease HII
MTRGRFISLLKERFSALPGFSGRILEGLLNSASLEEDGGRWAGSLTFLALERERVQRIQRLERSALRKGLLRIAGADEVGRGPLAGPLVAACVVFNRKLPFIPCIDDSKCLKESEREFMLPWIEEAAEAIGLGFVEADEIDRLNVHRASLEAMSRAVRDIGLFPDFLLVDGLFPLPSLPIEQKAVVKGDRVSFVVACASIVAKVTRDRIMQKLDRQYPHYGFSRNKGYPTADHVQALRDHGASPIHRKSYGPVKECLLEAPITG